MNANRRATIRLPRTAAGRALACAAAIFGACAALIASGCSSAASSSTVTLTYTPPVFVTPAQRAEGVGVRVAVQDERADRSKVGDVVGDSGTAETPITSTNNVTDVIGSAVRSGLETRGFNVGTGTVAMRIGIMRFTTLYKPGLLGGASDTYVELQVQVSSAEGKTVFRNTYSGRGRQPGVRVSSGRGAAAALDAALDQAITAMLTDGNLMDALVAAAEMHPAAPSAPS
jgi:uncharacterized lipoprotein YajG